MVAHGVTEVTASDDPLRENERAVTFYRPQTRMGGLMFAVDHSATALLIKRRFPSVSMTPLLVSVQAMELAWVALNYLGIEQTTTSARHSPGLHPVLAFRRDGRDRGARRMVGH